MKTRDKFIRVVAGLIVGVAIALVAVVSFVGCKSATKDIAEAAVEVSRRADKITQHSAAIQSELASPPDGVLDVDGSLPWIGGMNSHAVAIDENAKGITDSAAVVSERVTQVEDKVPWWASLLKLFAVIGVLALVVYAGIATGVFKLIHGVLMGFGWFIPKAKLSSAKLDYEAMRDPTVLPEAIASRRTIDPAYNAAYVKVKSSEGNA